MINNETLQDQVDSHIRRLMVWADRLDRKRCCLHNNALLWQTRGSQEVLRRVARHLQQMRVQYSSGLALERALGEYLQCLPTNIDDAREEAFGSGTFIERWKASGEARVLPRICARLSQLMHNGFSQDVMLSLDGKTLEFVGKLKDQEQQVRQAQVFPVLPEGLSLYQEELLDRLEDSLSRHSRTLVKIEEQMRQDNPGLFMACIDRLLQYTWVSHILVLVGSAPVKPLLERAYEEWVSLEDGELLSLRYPAQKLTTPLEPGVCISSIREMQLLICSDEPPPRNAFDVVVIYDHPSLSRIWDRVLDHFEASYLIGFSGEIDAGLQTLCGNCVVSRFDTT